MDELDELLLNQLADLSLKDSREIKRHIQVIQFSEGTDVYAYAYALKGKNVTLTITSQDGDPIQRSIYDAVRDVYVVEGVNWHRLGFVPVNYKLTMTGLENWEIDIPLPIKTIKRYLSTEQRRSFEYWLSHFHKDDYLINYLQFKGA